MEKKSAKQSLDLKSLQHSLQRSLVPIGKHLTTIMILIALGILIYTLITVQSIISSQDDQSYRDEQSSNRIPSKFDNDTIVKVDNLKASSDSSTIELPPGRRNPFIN